ncbi:signal peptide protein [Cohnella xylanilytica]|uniref:Signal peptide protein n=1 Tax=Cohnella xylanilytica TaxID=557555 RepID=A0A841U8P5_9BACL|nr:hypothetical protein [Cohnella xylanilytica]MBB6694623.1 signal peptide protein [Cohnella xylanilytica]
MNDYERRRRYENEKASARIAPIIIGGILLIVFLGILVNSCSSGGSQWEDSAVYWSDDNPSNYSSGSQTAQSSNTVPWDYRIVEGTVGDLIGGDMTLLPDNDLLPNDNNYATGDKVWALQYMGAVMKTDANDRTDVTLTSWKPIKSFKTKEAAEADLAKLKLSLKTEIDLVGVYKTTYKGQTREFAVLTLPSGQKIKQPIDEERYAKLKTQKKVGVVLEEVHDYSNYDMAYAKFRGWAA